MDGRTVWVSIALSFLVFVSVGVWGSVVLSPLLYALSESSNTSVGLAEGLQGAAQVAAALPAGILADRSPGHRVTVLRGSALLGLAAVAVMVTAIAPKVYSHSYLHLSLGLITWGAFRGSWDPVIKALFADAVDEGSRSKYFSYMFAATTLGSSVGPLFNVVYFANAGKESSGWALPQLQTAFLVGMALALLPICMLFLFRKQRESEDQSSSSQPSAAVQSLFARTPASRWIPAMVALSDVLGGLSSGMTIKFFPLFFKNECNFSSELVSIVFCGTPLLLAITSILAQKISRVIGRVQTVTFARLVGISLLVFMAYGKSYWFRPEIILPVYAVRTALMNCPYPLMKSILMDFVPQNERAKWNSVESISTFGWSGSAILGGFLADKFGYGGTFIVTAGLQFVSGLVAVPMIQWVPIEVKKLDQDPSLIIATAFVDPQKEKAGDEAAEPLLAPDDPSGESGEA